MSVDVARGHRLAFEGNEDWLSYADLAAGMVEAVVDEDGRYEGRNVAVVNKVRGVGAKFPRGTPVCVLLGLVRYWAPWLHDYLPATGPA